MPARACAVDIPAPAPVIAAARRSAAPDPLRGPRPRRRRTSRPGMVVHPAAGHAEGTLVNALLHHVDDLSGIGGELRPGIVHRLDRGTSGVDGGRKARPRARGAVAAVPRSRGREGVHRARLGRRAGRPADRRADRPGSARPPEDVHAGAARAIGRDAHHRGRAPSRRVAAARRDRDRPDAPDPRASQRHRAPHRWGSSVRRRPPAACRAICGLWRGSSVRSSTPRGWRSLIPPTGRRVEFVRRCRAICRSSSTDLRARRRR